MYNNQYLSVCYAFLKPATHYQTVAQTRHWTELGGWRSKVGKGVSKSGHLTPNTCPIQTSDENQSDKV